MSGPKRNPDKLNTIGVVVVGICSAVLVYVSIVALQAFYMNDTSEIQTMKDYGGQDKTAKGHRADELRNITEAASNAASPGAPATFRIPIEHAMKLVVEDAKKDPSHLVPSLPKSVTPTVEPIFGRPKPIGGAAPAGAAPAGGTPTPGGGTALPEGQTAPGAAPMTPTGSGPGAPPGGPAPAAAPAPARPAPAAAPAAPAPARPAPAAAAPARPAPARPAPAAGSAAPAPARP